MKSIIVSIAIALMSLVTIQVSNATVRQFLTV